MSTKQNDIWNENMQEIEESRCRNNCNERGCFSTLPPACHCPHQGMSCRDRFKSSSQKAWEEATNDNRKANIKELKKAIADLKVKAQSYDDKLYNQGVDDSLQAIDVFFKIDSLKIK